MEKYKGLPLINLDVYDDTPGIEIISLVDFPAVERNFIALAAEKVMLKADDERHVVTGVALIPDQKIYRRDENGEYYISFSKDAIERIATKFFADHNSTNANLMHEVAVDGCVYFESYLTDKARGIYPTDFGELPDGSWVVSCKVLNPEVWQLVKDGVLRGFSVEGVCREAKTEITSVEELMEYLNNIK